MTSGRRTVQAQLGEVARSAEMSACGSYRFLLRRVWAAGPRVLFVLHNPSRADASVDDPTVRRCTGFARTLGCGSLEIANLYAWRAAQPGALRHVADPVGPANDRWIADAADDTDGPLVAGWGAAADPNRAAQVLHLLAARRPVMCLGTTAAGQPRHPLYVPAATDLRLLRGRAAASQDRAGPHLL